MTSAEDQPPPNLAAVTPEAAARGGGSVSLGLASPLTLLLEEEAHRDRQAQEILLLTYTCDLGFFETFILGIAQACGARVTLVADATQAAVDPRSARRAGRSYLPGLAAHRGAFHPKLVLIAGEQRITAAIGSGNATIAGWQGNAELWTVLRGDDTGAPAALADLSTWLRILPDRAAVSRGVPDALERCAALLDRLLGSTAQATNPDVRLVHSGNAPILDQLPTDPVDELAVAAPFHDPGAATLSTLLDRLRPTRLRVAYQPGLTVLDGRAVTDVLADYASELVVDTDSRYRHGKLVEWSVDGRRYALTGSPNLSGAALGTAMAHGGNCELALITHIKDSLFPVGEAADADHRTALAATCYVIAGSRPAGPLLLSATRVEAGIEVLLARPLASPARVYLSPAAAPPETWELAGELPEGARVATVAVPAVGGSRVRLAIPGPALAAALDQAHTDSLRSDDQDPWSRPVRYGNTVFVVDPVRVLARPTATGSRPPTTEPVDLFSDPKLAERFYADLTTLRSSYQPAPGTATGLTSADPDSITHHDASPDSWERYLDRCAGRIGSPLLRFALALPEPPASGDGDILPAVSWVEEVVSDTEAGLDTDTPEEQAAQDAGPEPPTPALPDLTVLPDADRRRYRRWCERLVDAASRLEPLDRMLITRLVLWTAAAGAWPSTDQRWVPLLSRAVEALGASSAPAPAQPPMASLAAVALSVLRDATPRYEPTEHSLAYDRAAAAVRKLLPAAQEAYVADYTDLLAPAFGGAVTTTAVITVVDDLLAADPVADAIWSLADVGRDAHRDGPRLLHVPATSGNPALTAVLAVGAAQDAGRVAAWAGQRTGRWALCLWDEPNLYTIEHAAGTTLWRHRRLPPRITPRTLAVTRSFDSATLVPHGPLRQPVGAAQQLLSKLGIDPSDPAPALGCC